MLNEMKRDPRYWSAYYMDPERQDFDLQFSLSDRMRYYWNTPVVERACTQLFERLASMGIPLTLISQYLPVQYAAIREGRLTSDPRELVLDAVEQVLRHYERACRPAGPAGRTIIDRGPE
jgi:D-tagatose-1,6-bisphosphate aldolase subunit GatZ/KbaZ